MAVERLSRYVAECDGCRAIGSEEEDLERYAEESAKRKGWDWIADDFLCPKCLAKRATAEGPPEYLGHGHKGHAADCWSLSGDPFASCDCGKAAGLYHR